jgi:hypothetical protein
MPPMTSMVASNRPSRRAKGWEEFDSVCGTGALKMFLPEGEILSELRRKR